MINWREEFDKIWLETLHKSQDDMIDRMEMKVFIETQIIQKIIEEMEDTFVTEPYSGSQQARLNQLKARWLSK